MKCFKFKFKCNLLFKALWLACSCPLCRLAQGARQTVFALWRQLKLHKDCIFLNFSLSLRSVTWGAQAPFL